MNGNGLAQAVRVRGLRKSYGATAAVGGIDLDISPGRGPRPPWPERGRQDHHGGDPRRPQGPRWRAGQRAWARTRRRRADRAWRARIGIVLQLAVDAPELTVAEMVEHFAGLLPEPAAPGRGDRPGPASTDKARSRIHALSGGQQRRLDVALGLVGAPELLFLDEPTTGFDPQARHAFWDVIRSLVRRRGHGAAHHALPGRGGGARGPGGGDLRRCRSSPRGRPANWARAAPMKRSVAWQGLTGLRRQRTDEPTRLVGELAAAYGGEVPGLTVTRPSLEDVYLELTGGRAVTASRMTLVRGLRATARELRAPLPSVWRIGWSRGRVELKSFFRERQSVVFNFAMPAVMLVLLGAVFGGQQTGPGVTIGDLYVAGLIGGGVDGTSYQNLGMSIAFERGAVHAEAAARHADAAGGLLRREDHPGPGRLRGRGRGAAGGRRWPVPPAAAHVDDGLVDVHVGVRPRRGGLLAAGIAASSLPRSAARNGVAVVTLPFIVLQFISGVYVPFTLVPSRGCRTSPRCSR